MFKPIANPYIVGNPIKSKKMFYGRRDDFDFIKRKLESGVKSYIIIFCGERRSGKTSILFQILNGELGEKFLPILIDMQNMAGLRNDYEFFEKLALEIIRTLDNPAIDISHYSFSSPEMSPYKVFDKFLADIRKVYSDKNILLLIDEYELIETKIQESTLDRNFITYLSGVLESDSKISFIFTGSKNIEDRDFKLWNILFAKSLYRNVSFLSENDTYRLINEPLSGQVTYASGIQASIYRLTAGQPFYTQVVCQNIVDHLNENTKNNVDREDLNVIIDAILQNPLPQMIYFWNSLAGNRKLILSLLAEILQDENDKTTAEKIKKISSKREYGINLTIKTISTTLESLFHARILKKEDNFYSFQMDLLRLWIKRDHSFWQVMKEVGSVQNEEAEIPTEAAYEFKEKTPVLYFLLPLIVVLAAIAYFIFLNSGPSSPKENTAQSTENNISKPQSSETTAPGQNKKQKNTEINPTPTRTSEAEKKQSSPSKHEDIPKITQETKQTSPGTETKSSDNPAEATNQAKEDAANARLKMLDAKQQAQQSSAAELTSALFNSAEEKETQAEGEFSSGQFNESINTFSQAENAYANAASQAESASKRLSSEVVALKNEVASIKQNLIAEHKSLVQYQEGIAAEAEGNAHLKQNGLIAAKNSFLKAKNLLQQTIDIRKRQTTQIQNILRKYEKALADKDINQLENLYDNFTEKSRKDWLQLFKSVDNIKSEMHLQSLHFAENTAEAAVDVDMKYSGFVNSNQKFRWDVEFIDMNNQMLISNINQKSK